MSNSNFYIVGKHPVIEALKNPKRKVIKLFLTEESKKTIHRENNKVNLLKDIKVYFKTKKELDKYCKNDFVSADAISMDTVCKIAKSLRLSDAINSVGICLVILSPTVILLHLFTTC